MSKQDKQVPVPHELRILLEFLSPESNTTTNEPLKLDSIKFIKWVNRHRIAGHLLNANQTAAVQLPESLLAEVKTLNQKNTLKAMKMAHEIHRLNHLFKNHDIQAISTKGILLGNELYGNIHQRYAGDIDLIMKIDDLIIADTLMLEAGYKRYEFQGGTEKRKRVHLAISHQLAYIHPERQILVELLRSVTSKFSHPEVLLPENLKTIQLGKETIKTLSAEMHFVQLCVHGAGHAWARLHWLMDISCYMQREEIDWQRIIQLSKELKVLDLIVSSMDLTTKLLNVKSPIDLSGMRNAKQEKIIRHCVDAIQDLNHPPTGFKNFQRVIYTFGLPMKYDIKGMIKRSAYNMNDWELIHLPDSLFFLYFFLRPFLYILRKLRIVRNSI